MSYRIVPRGERDLLGEGPLWSPSAGALYWIDILAPALRRLDLDSGEVRSWPMPEPIGWAIEQHGSDDLVIGLKSGFATLSLDPVAIVPIGDPEPERPDNRLNDAKADAYGRIWAGSKHDRDETASGALHRLDRDLGWTRVDDGYGVANGPAFSPDGSTLYHTDSAIRTVYASDLAADGALSGKRVLLRFDETWGHPDGMTVDRDGGLWIAHWGGGRVSRFHPDGGFDRSIALPARNVTSIAFAGPALDRMFVTSSGDGQDGPYDGALFEVSAGATGIAPHRFGPVVPPAATRDDRHTILHATGD